MEKIKMFVFNILLQKYVLGWAVKGYKGLSGYKTQVCMGLYAAVWLASKLGYIEDGLANQVELGLQVAGGFSFAEKLAKIDPYVNKGIDAVKDASK